MNVVATTDLEETRAWCGNVRCLLGDLGHEVALFDDDNETQDAGAEIPDAFLKIVEAVF